MITDLSVLIITPLFCSKPNTAFVDGVSNELHDLVEVAVGDGHGLLVVFEHFEIGGFGSVLEDGTVLAE